MTKSFLTCLSLAALCALQGMSAETFRAYTGAHFTTAPGYTWSEIDGVKYGSDGRISVAGALAPFQKSEVVEGGYYALPASSHVVLRERAREEFTSTLGDEKVTRFAYTEPQREEIVVAEGTKPGSHCSECAYSAQTGAVLESAPIGRDLVVIIIKKDGSRETLISRGKSLPN